MRKQRIFIFLKREANLDPFNMPEQKEIFDTYVVECITCGGRLQDAVQCNQCGSRPLMRSMTKVNCMKHGEFHIRLSKLLHGAGCPKCVQSSISMRRLPPKKKVYVKCKNGHEYFTEAIRATINGCPFCEGKLHTKDHFIVNGKTYSSLSEVSVDYNIPERAILTRLRNGMNLDQAVAAQTKQTHARWQGDFEKWKKVQENFQKIEPGMNSPVDYIQSVTSTKSIEIWTDKEKARLVEFSLEGVLIDTIAINLKKSPEEILRMMKVMDMLEKHAIAHPEYLQSMADAAAKKSGAKFGKIIASDESISASEVARLIEGHENNVVEFKQTFSKDVNTGQPKSITIIHSAIKTIAGFANSTGGTLIIGVADDQTITGIENDHGFTNGDQYLLNLGHQINTWLTDYGGTLVNMSVVTMEPDKSVCVVKVKQSKIPVFCSHKKYENEKEQFFVRQNNKTISLDTSALLKYCETHFDLARIK